MKGGKVYGNQVKQKVEFSPFNAMTKYGDRGSNLAVSFLRWGKIPQVRTSEAEMGLILVVNRDDLNWERSGHVKRFWRNPKENFFGSRSFQMEEVKL